MKSVVYFGTIVLLLTAPTTAYARDEKRFVIDEYGWELIQSDGVCAARALFTGPEGTALVELRKRTPSDLVEATIVGPGLSKRAGLDHRLSDWKPMYRLTSAEDGKEIGAVGWIDGQGNLNGATFRLSVGRVSKPDALDPPTSSAELQQIRFERFSEVEGIYLDNLFRDPAIFETGSLSSMMKLMDACTDGIVEAWGISSAEDHALSQRSRPVDAEDMVKKVSARYPDLLQQPGTAEVVDVRVLLDAAGNATDCATNPGANQRFAEATCRVLSERVRFEPALDSEGNPVPSYYVNTVFYVLSEP